MCPFPSMSTLVIMWPESNPITNLAVAVEKEDVKHVNRRHRTLLSAILMNLAFFPKTCSGDLSKV